MASNFLHFMQFSAKILPNNRLVPPPLGLMPPSTLLESPGSTTGYVNLSWTFAHLPFLC